MKRNLLMLLFAMLIGVFTSKAQDVEFTIDIDNPASATVVIGTGPVGEAIELVKGENPVSGTSGYGVFITPASGTEITVNVNGTDLAKGYGGFYSRTIEEGMTVKITTVSSNEDPGKKVSIEVDNASHIVVTDGIEGTPVTLVDGVNDVYLKNNPLSVKAADGFKIETVTKNSDTINPGYGDVYNMGVAEGMVVKITTVSENAPSFTIDIDNPESVTAVIGYGPVGEGLELEKGENVLPVPETGNALFITPTSGTEITVNVTNSQGSKDLSKGNGGFYSTAIEQNMVVKITTVGSNEDPGKKVSIDVDNASHVVVTDGIDGTLVTLVDGVNDVYLKNNPLSVKAADGFIIESVTKNSDKINPGNGDVYNMGVAEGMVVKITTAVKEEPKVTIDVDKAENVEVRAGGQYGKLISLQNGENIVETDAEMLVIMAVDGAKIESLTNNGTSVEIGYQNMYYVDLTAGRDIKITTSGEPLSTIEVMFAINVDNSVSVSSDGETTPITNYASIPLKKGEYAVLAPAVGYVIEKCEPYSINDFVDNEDGTFKFIPEKSGFIQINTKAQGFEFNVETAVASNIIITALSETNEPLRTIALEGANGKYVATAPMSTASITFAPVEGGEISSIKRISNGTESNVTGGGQGGYRSAVAEGDTFVVEALGPEATVKFWGFGTSNTALNLSNFVVKAGEETLELEGETAEAKVRIGEIITVAGAKGYALKESDAIDGGSATVINNQTAMITGSGNIFLYAVPVEGMIINIDNAAAVTVKGANGTGTVIELVNGENKLESVANPLKISANATFSITSVVLNGEALTTTDGTYTAELLPGSTLTIKTKGEPKPFPLSVYTENGETSDLIITKDGEEIDLAAGPVPVKEGDEIVISAQLGSIIETVTASNGGTVSEDKDNDAWTVVLGNGSMIDVTFLKPAAGKALVGFSRDSDDVQAWLYDKNGERKSDPASLKAGKTIEVEIGDQIKFFWYKGRDINEILVNGKAIEPQFEPFVNTEGETTKNDISNPITIEGNSIIEVTTTEKEKFVDVTGYEAIDVEGKSGIVIGSMFINEIGQLHANLRHGEKFYVIPVATKGYKFNGFVSITGSLPVPEPVDGKYEFTVPESESVEYIMFRGEFVVDKDNPAYIIEGNSIYDDGEGTERKLMGLTRIDNGTELGTVNVMAYEGDVVKLLFFQNIDEFPESLYTCENFCLFDDPEVIIAQNYVVNPKDAHDGNKIQIGAIVKAKSSGVENAVAENALSYDASSATVKSDKAVKVFTVSGMLVKELPAGEGSLETLPAGIYIVSNGIDTIKISR